MRERSTLYADQLIQTLQPRLPDAVKDALERRQQLVGALEEVKAERGTIRTAAAPEAWRDWVVATERAILRTEALDVVIASMVAMRDTADGAVVSAVVDAAPEIHAALAQELASLLAAARPAAAVFVGAPLPGGDAVPHLDGERAAAWHLLDDGARRYSELRQAEWRLRGLTGDREPDPALCEFRDPTHVRLWGTKARWLSRRTSGATPGPTDGRPLSRFAWLSSLPPSLVWLPDAGEEAELLERLRIKPVPRQALVGAYAPRGGRAEQVRVEAGHGR